MNSIARAVFYSDGNGDLPFVFGKVEPEQYYILVIKPIPL
jgi:hypothetical protein